MICSTANSLDPLGAHFLSLWVQSWHFAWAGVGKMNVITVKLRRPTIPKAPQAAKIILGGLKRRGRCSVSYCCRVTQARGTPMGSQGWAFLFKRAPSALCTCPPLSHEERPPPPPDVLPSAIPATFPRTVRAWALLAWWWCPWALVLLEKRWAALIQFSSIQH